MRKTFFVMRHEFLRHITRRGFIFAILGMPLIMLVIIGGIILFFTGKADDAVGVVDEPTILLEPAAYLKIEDESMPFIKYPDENSALNALKNNEIQAFFILPNDYMATGRITLFHEGDAFDEIPGAVADYIRASLLSNADVTLRERFRDNNLNLSFISLSEEKKSISPTSIILPFLIGFIFLISIFSTSGSLIQAIVDEKENRTMEILITSLKPSQLMIGKILGLVGLGLLQIGVWLGFTAIGFAIARANFPNMPVMTFSSSAILIAVLWFVPLFVLVASLITAIGISITAVAEGQQMVAIINIISMFPLYFTGLIIENPNSGLAISLSLIPFSAPLSILTLSQITTLPTWQYLLSWGLLVASTILALFLVSRLLQVGLLRYGKKLSFRDVLQAARPGKASFTTSK